ncbi:hypothetical protein COO60DRAFT_1685561 [Scenedesmus sp. NREL 46B-D3]|nr:hypothetical protein COO60DRAFT_1685561 [Scenedesmus sp. NREL 46B-D3]
MKLVLQHPDTALDAETICSLLCSSRAIWTAAQQAGGPCSSIALQGGAGDTDTLSRVASFARWLRAHAHLVGDVDIYVQDHTAEQGSAHNVVDTLLAFGFHQAGSSRGSRSGSRASSGLRQQQRQPPPFGLRIFSSSPLARLTSLHIATLDVSPADVWAFPANLVRLQLPDVNPYNWTAQEMAAGGVLEVEPAFCLDLGNLSRLTSLQLGIVGRDLRHVSGQLPPQLIELDVPVDLFAFFAPLTRLQEVRIAGGQLTDAAADLRALTCLQLVNMWGEAPSKDALDGFWGSVFGQLQERE